VKIKEEERDSIQYIGDVLTEKRAIIPEKFGICSTCKSFAYQRTAFDKERFGCIHNNNDSIHPEKLYQPSCIDPVVECISFYPRGQQELWEMLPMAIAIDNSNKKTPGFEIPLGITDSNKIRKLP